MLEWNGQMHLQAQIPLPKEVEMSVNRLFKLLIALALVIAVVLTVQKAVATTIIAPKTNPEMECASLPSRYSIHNEYVEGIGWVTHTEDGPTGVDGGLIALMSSYRTCSR